MAENLEEVEQDAVPDAPSTEEVVTEQLETIEEEKELSDEELQAEIDRLREEAKKEEDPKEKRHKEQDIGWKMKIIKEREKARALEEENSRKQKTLQAYENSLVEDAYNKTIDENFGLAYFEELAKSNPEIAERVAREKWNRTAKQLILDTKKELAANGDEDSRKQVTEEEIRAKVYHEVAVEQAQSLFEDLTAEEQVEAKEYFDEMIEGKILNPSKAKKFAEMAKLYATKNRKEEKPKIDKERVLAEKASTGISPKSGTKETIVQDTNAIRKQLIGA